MKLQIDLDGENSFDVEIADDSNLMDLKRKVREYHGELLHEQFVKVEGKKLESDGALLRDCGISDGDKIRIDVKTNLTFMIEVKQLTGKTIFLFKLSADCTVDDLKEHIQDKEGIPPDSQRLITPPSALQNGMLLSDYEMRPGRVCHMVLRLRDGRDSEEPKRIIDQIWRKKDDQRSTKTKTKKPNDVDKFEKSIVSGIVSCGINGPLIHILKFFSPIEALYTHIYVCHTFKELVWKMFSLGQYRFRPHYLLGELLGKEYLHPTTPHTWLLNISCEEFPKKRVSLQLGIKVLRSCSKFYCSQSFSPKQNRLELLYFLMLWFIWGERFCSLDVFKILCGELIPKIFYSEQEKNNTLYNIPLSFRIRVIGMFRRRGMEESHGHRGWRKRNAEKIKGEKEERGKIAALLFRTFRHWRLKKDDVLWLEKNVENWDRKNNKVV